MKKTCNGCRALTRDNNGLKCELKYRTEPKMILYGKEVEIKPVEECPKPKSYEEYNELISL